MRSAEFAQLGSGWEQCSSAEMLGFERNGGCNGQNMVSLKSQQNQKSALIRNATCKARWLGLQIVSLFRLFLTCF